ncbi:MULTISPECIES: tryptophan-rich sensory protein [unclassified Glutamicibacter]|uniref:tryptophan-rich sensory protein n=1 Tax=unclassified Glutamicibacter TaxID=2627139 RepID=UPI00382D4532
MSSSTDSPNFPYRAPASATSWALPVFTAIALVLAIAVSFIGSGALGGTPVQQAAGGYLGADSTLLAPAGPAFSIWSVIYAGLAVYGIFQLTPAGRRSAWAAKLRIPALLSALLNAAWITVVQLGWLGASVAVIFILVACLAWMLTIMVAGTPASRTEYWIMWLTFGIYLGWVCVASIANTSAWLLSLGFGQDASWAPGAAVALLVVAAAIGLGTTAYSGRIFTALAMAWGLGWIGVSRLAGSNQSELAGYSALGCAAMLLLGSMVIAWRKRGVRTP